MSLKTCASHTSISPQYFMRLLYLSSTRFPSERAHGAQIAHVCNSFAQVGVDVTLVAPRRAIHMNVDPYEYYNIPKSFKIKHIYCTPFKIATKFGFFLNLIVYIGKSLGLVLWKKNDIIYSRDEFVLYIMSFFVTNASLVWESHEAKFNFAARSLLRRGIRCVAISEGIRDFYIDNAIATEQILVAHDGIDSSFFATLESKREARSRLGIQTKKPIVMYIGGLDTYKGVEDFLGLSVIDDGIQCVLMGGTKEKIALYRERYPRVLFLGSRLYSELPNNQQAADVLVCTNSTSNAVSEKYTSPLKLFSYITSAVPVVAADVVSIRNITTEDHVFFYTPGSVNSLRAVIEEIIHDPQTATQRAQAAMTFSQQFLWDNRASQIVNFVSQ